MREARSSSCTTAWPTCGRDPHGLAVRPDRFVQHCEILRQRCEVVPLCDAKRALRQVAITFDDGYVDNAGEARRILEAAGLPATFFVTVGRVGTTRSRRGGTVSSRSFGSAALPRTRSNFEIRGRRLWADIRSPGARARAHLALFWRLRPLCLADIESMLADIETQLGVRSFDRESHRWMTMDELRALVGEPPL